MVKLLMNGKYPLMQAKVRPKCPNSAITATTPGRRYIIIINRAIRINAIIPASSMASSDEAPMVGLMLL